MSTQPEALRLADLIEGSVSDLHREAAAAELRRLHALLQEWEAKAATWLASPEAAQRLDGYRQLSQRANRAEAQRDALLEALMRALRVEDRKTDEFDAARAVERFIQSQKGEKE